MNTVTTNGTDLYAQLAHRMRTALGEFNDYDRPLETLVKDLADFKRGHLAKSADKAGVSDAVENLRAVLCDPEGCCCITGSEGDRKVIDESLAALTHFAQSQSAEAARDGERYRLISSRFNDMSASKSERFLECLGIEGNVLAELAESIDAALKEQSHNA